MTPLRSWILLLVLAAVAAPARAADCKKTTFGKCYTVHARYNIYADGDGLWIVGTHHRLTVVDDKLDKMLEAAGWQTHSLFGDFVVCPESRYVAGEAQAACIQSYKNIRLAKWN